MSTPTSYLQTLTNEEAIAFIASLQKVKDHLSEELKWITQQAEQKTVQLQGIETLLTEAETLGLLASTTKPAIAATATDQSTDSTAIVGNLTANTQHNPKAFEDDATSDESLNPNQQTGNSVAALPVIEPPSTTPAAAKTQAKVQTRTAKKPSATKTKKPGQSSSKGKSLNVAKDLKDLLLPKFAGKSLKNTVTQILETAKKPLHLDQLLIEMYGTLANDDFKRAKISLANVLAVGKSKGEWQNLGQGLYASNSVSTS